MKQKQKVAVEKGGGNTVKEPGLDETHVERLLSGEMLQDGERLRDEGKQRDGGTWMGEEKLKGEVISDFVSWWDKHHAKIHYAAAAAAEHRHMHELLAEMLDVEGVEQLLILVLNFVEG